MNTAKDSRVYFFLESTTVGGKDITYNYNADGLRTEKTVDGKTTTYVLDGDQVVMELGSSYNVTKRYLRGFNLISSDTGEATARTYYNYNAHGDVTQLVNEAGVVTKNYKYDSFGNEIGKDSTDTNVFRYSGETVDLETGYIYLRARYYDPGIGRFISEDSYTGELSDSLSLNLYNYCGNDGVNNVDLSGHDFIFLYDPTFVITGVESGHCAIAFQYKSYWYYASFEPFAWNGWPIKIPDIDLIYGELKSEWINNKSLKTDLAYVWYTTSSSYYKTDARRKFTLSNYKKQVYVTYDLNYGTLDKARDYAINPPYYSLTCVAFMNCASMVLYLLLKGTSVINVAKRLKGRIWDKNGLYTCTLPAFEYWVFSHTYIPSWGTYYEGYPYKVTINK